jgi:hypothetical protein
MTTKPFPMRTLLSVTTGRLLTEPQGERDNGIGDIYELLGWMTSDTPFTHQLKRFSNECKPWLLRWFPELTEIGSKESLDRLDTLLGSEGGLRGVSTWLNGLAACRKTYDVPRIPADDHERKDAYDELVVQRGTDEGIVIAPSGPDSETQEAKS